MLIRMCYYSTRMPILIYKLQYTNNYSTTHSQLTSISALHVRVSTPLSIPMLISVLTLRFMHNPKLIHLPAFISYSYVPRSIRSPSPPPSSTRLLAFLFRISPFLLSYPPFPLRPCTPPPPCRRSTAPLAPGAAFVASLTLSRGGAKTRRCSWCPISSCSIAAFTRES